MNIAFSIPANVLWCAGGFVVGVIVGVVGFAMAEAASFRPPGW
jgi:hypothetical protein